MPNSLTNRHPLFAAASDEDFLNVCTEMVASSEHVELHEDRISDELVAHVAASKPISWEWYLAAADGNLQMIAFEFAFNAALNGGYFEEKDGTIRQWEVKGSGSEALLQWIARLRKKKLMPFVDLDMAAVSARLPVLLEGQPLAGKRLAICREFADEARFTRFLRLLDATAIPDRFQKPAFLMEHADRLADIYPAGFCADPFRKKALLFFLMMAGFLESRGRNVSYRLPLPSDYQIPRILQWQGVIEVSSNLETMLRSDFMIDVTSEPVDHYRAAAVVAGRKIAQMAGRDDHIVDGALFGTFRKDPDFLEKSLPPMRCASLWF